MKKKALVFGVLLLVPFVMAFDMKDRPWPSGEVLTYSGATIDGLTPTSVPAREYIIVAQIAMDASAANDSVTITVRMENGDSLKWEDHLALAGQNRVEHYMQIPANSFQIQDAIQDGNIRAYIIVKR